MVPVITCFPSIHAFYFQVVLLLCTGFPKWSTYCIFQVMLVKWNEPYQKLATCDVTGVIFVWIKHEGRWSIELINDRNSQVRVTVIAHVPLFPL